MITLNRVRVNREPVPPPATPPMPRTAAEAEPYEPATDHAPTTTAHRANRFRGWLTRAVAWWVRLREEAIREANHAGIEMGRASVRAEIQAELRSRLQAGHYDLRDGTGAVRMILAHLAEESQ